MAAVLVAYDRALTARPILTKTLTSMVLFGLGDVMSQQMEGAPKVDWGRTSRMAAWGALFTPLAHVWYLKLDQWIPGKGAVVVASKVAADQLTWTVGINSLFFFTTSFMVNRDVGASVQAVHDKLWPTLKVNWMVWPVLTGFNLSMVPLQYRILFINFCSLFWSAFLSNQANTSKGSDTGATVAPVTQLK